MEWFFAFSENASKWFEEMIQVAVLSAKKNTTLEPHCIYDGENSYLTDWLVKEGVVVHRDQVPFRDELFSEKVIELNRGSAYKPAHAAGHFLRLLVAKHATGDLAIYTDCDVMFSADPQIHLPETVSAVPELSAQGIPSAASFNSGVMAFNMPHFREVNADLIEFCREAGFYRPHANSYDQVLLNLYFSRNWERLPPELNWRPTQGINEKAAIIHFHGPKPHRVRAIIEGKGISAEAGHLDIIDRCRTAYDHYLKEFYSYLNETEALAGSARS